MGMEKRGMEGVVDFPLRRKLHAVGHGADYLRDFEGTKALSTEFRGGMCRFEICSFNPYLLSLLIGAEGRPFVPETLCLGHGFVSIFSCLFHQSFSFFYCRHVSFSCRLVCAWQVTHPGHKGGLLGSYGNLGVQRVLQDGQPSCPVVLLVIAVNAECGFKGLIGALGLSICLRMISRTEVLSYVQLPADLSEEFGGESCITIRDNS